MTFDIREVCPTCGIEGSRLETWDDHAVPLATRCRLCGHAMRRNVSALEELTPARPIRSLAELEAALTAWAHEEGLESAADLVEAYFALTSTTAIYEALVVGDPVETTFDVADYLFSGGAAGGGATAGPSILREEETAPSTMRIPQPVSIARLGGPRDELLALASVAAADGEAHPDDLAALLRAAQKRGVPPLDPPDIRVWRPNEVAPPSTLPDRERVLEEMFRMGWADGQMDESEIRVIKDFARAWGIDPERLREWIKLYSFGDANRVERWFRRIGLFLFPAR
jgi:Zn ribbon nucleic-acid-binding protein